MDGTLKIASVTGVDLELRIAGPGGRSYAFIVDWHIRVLLAAAWFFVGTFGYFGTVNGIPELGATPAGFVYVVVVPAFAIYFLYHPVLEVAMRGRTPGKRIAGVRLVKRDGGVPGVGALLVRNLFRLVDAQPLIFYCVGLAATMLTRHSVRIGDIAAGTLLIYDEPERRVAFADLSSGGVDRLGLKRAELVRDLLNRWEELQPEVRASLARKLLAAAAAVPPDDSDASLHGALEALLK